MGYNYMVDKVCPPDLVRAVGNYYYFRVLNNACFLFVSYQSVPYETAQQICRNSGGSLAMPKTKFVNDFLLGEMKLITSKPMWIGMHDKVNEGIWMWEDGSKVTSWGNTNYFNDGLFGHVEDCMALDPMDNQWHDYRCSNFGLLPNARLNYICQYSKQVGYNSDNPHGQGGNFYIIKDQGNMVHDMTA